jgi:hypothetical protein
MWDFPKLWTYSLIPPEAKSSYPYIFLDYDTWCHQDRKVHFGLNMIFSKLEGLKHVFNLSKQLKQWIKYIWVILIQHYLYHLEKTITLISIKVHCSV